MNTTRKLDFLSLPNIDGMDIFKRHDLDVENALKPDGPLPEVHERANAALMFLCGPGEKSDGKKTSAYLRAGLNEFYGIEDAARRDFKNHKIDSLPPKISDSSNPLVHLMYLLRHVNVHAKISSTDIHQTSLISKLGGEEREVDWQAVILDTPTFSDLLKCHEARKHYDCSVLEQAAKWLDQEQYTFGVGEVFRRGLSCYCRELLISARLVA